VPLVHATWFGWCCLTGRGQGRAKYSNRNHPRQPPVTVPVYLPPGAAQGGARRREAGQEERRPTCRKVARNLETEARRNRGVSFGPFSPPAPHRAAGNRQLRSEGAALLPGPLAPRWVYFSTASALQETAQGKLQSHGDQLHKVSIQSSCTPWKHGTTREITSRRICQSTSSWEKRRAV